MHPLNLVEFEQFWIIHKVYCHCNGSVDKILYQFISSSWSIQLIENRTTSCYSVPVSQLDFISECIDQSQTNNKEVEQFWRKLINFLSNEFLNLGNELIQYFINTSMATTVSRAVASSIIGGGGWYSYIRVLHN